MTRRARLSIPGIPWHIIQRGNNKTACFYSNDDYEYYLYHLKEQTHKYGCLIHAYALLEVNLDADIDSEIRVTTNGNYVLGNQKFQKEIEEVLGRRVTKGKSGRPVCKLDK